MSSSSGPRVSPEARAGSGLAFHQAARKLDVDLQIVFGRAVDEPNPCSRIHGGIYDLISPENTDGVVMISTVLAAHCGVPGLSRFVERFGDLALASVGVELPAVPSVIVDNQRAMDIVIEHVIGHHRRRSTCRRSATPSSRAWRTWAWARRSSHASTTRGAISCRSPRCGTEHASTSRPSSTACPTTSDASSRRGCGRRKPSRISSRWGVRVTPRRRRSTSTTS